MARRSKDWNEGLAQDLKHPQFVRNFLKSCLEEGISLSVALRKVILSMGLKEFSKKSKMASPNILRVLNPNYNPTQDTLNRLLKPLGLKLTVAPIDLNIRHKKAA